VSALSFAAATVVATAASASSTFDWSLDSLRADSNTTILITFDYACPTGTSDEITIELTDVTLSDFATGAVTYTATICDDNQHTTGVDVPMITDAVHSGDHVIGQVNDVDRDNDRTGHTDRDDVSVLSDFLNDAHIL
jgi:hypothetical protein